MDPRSSFVRISLSALALFALLSAPSLRAADLARETVVAFDGENAS